eukprot:1120070-Prymnesium_polylepis.1
MELDIQEEAVTDDIASSLELTLQPQTSVSDDTTIDFRLHVMQVLLEQPEGSRRLAARQRAAEDSMRRACLRWMYPDELAALRAFHSN